MKEEFMNTPEEQDQDVNAPANETKAEKFLRLAPARVDKVLNGIGSLKKLSVRGTYEYTPEQIEKIFSALRTAMDDCEEAFKPKEKTQSAGFSF